MRRKVLLTVAMVLVATMFAACSGKTPDKPAGAITPGVTDEKKENPTKAPADKETVEDKDAVEDEGTVEDKDISGDEEIVEDKDVTEKQEGSEDKNDGEKTDDVKEPETAEEENEDSNKTTSLGRVQGGVYVNEYMGITCKLDENWEFFTAEELQELPKNVEELFEGTDVEEVMSNLQVITDMSAENLSELTTMNIQYQKIGVQERLTFAHMDNSEILDTMLVVQKDSLIDTYAQVGIEVKDMYTKSVEFCGEQRKVLCTESEWEGVPYYLAQMIDYSLGDYSVTMTVSSFLEDKTDDLLQLFSKYE